MADVPKEIFRHRLEGSTVTEIGTEGGLRLRLEHGLLEVLCPWQLSHLGRRLASEGYVEALLSAFESSRPFRIETVAFSPRGDLKVHFNSGQLLDCWWDSDEYDNFAFYGDDGEMIICGPEGRWAQFGAKPTTQAVPSLRRRP